MSLQRMVWRGPRRAWVEQYDADSPNHCHRHRSPVPCLGCWFDGIAPAPSPVADAVLPDVVEP